MSTALAPAFIDGQYSGYADLKQLKAFESEARKVTKEKLRNESTLADVYVYAYYSYKSIGEIESAHFYSGYPKTYSEYDHLAELPRVDIRAIFHR